MLKCKWKKVKERFTVERRYSEYTYEELRREVGELTEKARKAEQFGMVNEYAVHQRKITMAQAYMLNPKDFKKGETYEIEGDPSHTFYIVYINGVFAWGFRKDQHGNYVEKKEEERITGEPEEALPISMLGARIDIDE
ncbi:YfhH family protein [Salimicrobium album]|uniref:YfhH family protein n=1 Tax=Salimicrobium album TaxID=50717 RepID=UPI000B89895D|nr:YfhH family protein [Salimicrobium album]